MKTGAALKTLLLVSGMSRARSPLQEAQGEEPSQVFILILWSPWAHVHTLSRAGGQLTHSNGVNDRSAFRRVSVVGEKARDSMVFRESDESSK